MPMQIWEDHCWGCFQLGKANCRCKITTMAVYCWHFGRDEVQKELFLFRGDQRGIDVIKATAVRRNKYTTLSISVGGRFLYFVSEKW